MMAHMYKNGLTNDANIAQSLWDRVEGNTYSGTYWPLTLELTHLQIPNGSAITASGAEPPLRALHDGQLSIFDWSAGPVVFKLPPGKKGKPKRAIEAYTSDYDDDSDYGYTPDYDLDDGIDF